MDNDPAFVMVSCTTNLRGTYRVHIQDGREPVGSDFDVTCRVHAIGHRDIDAETASSNEPDRAGTWYLITLKQLAWRKNPMWVHEDDGRLDLGY
ncbi:MAG TPA: hypothetical protein VIU87_27345 [Mycobacterium sp.]